jgi:hypothetical protein
LLYLWAVHKKLVPPSILAVDDSQDASEWASRQHFAYICPMPPIFPVPPAPISLAPGSPFKSMTEELRKIGETNEKHLLKDSQTADPKKKVKWLGEASRYGTKYGTSIVWNPGWNGNCQ